jgi:hypothetical protein
MSIQLARRGAISKKPVTTPLAGTLLGQWGFEDDNLNDSSGNGHHGAFEYVSGSSYSYIDGPQSGTRAIQWGADGQGVNVGRTGLEPTMDGYTIMGWIKTGTVPDNSYPGILGKSRDGAGSSRSRIGVVYEGGTKKGAYLARWKNDIQVGNFGSVNDTNWHHIALVDGNTAWAFYIDGAGGGGGRAFDNTSSPTWEAYDWKIGNNTGVGTIALTGQAVSGVRIIQGQLTAAQVADWMNTPIT